jgi:hypothetical protein
MRTEPVATQPRTIVEPADRTTRPAVYLAAGFCLLIAAVYLMIGLTVVTVIQPSDDQPVFGFIAAAAFAGSAMILLAVRRRIVWIALAAVQVFIAFTYFDLAAERVPAFEPWGIVLRILQIPLLAALGYLVVRTPRRSATA